MDVDKYMHRRRIWVIIVDITWKKLGEKAYWALSQRRVWVVLLSIASFSATYFGSPYFSGITSILAGSLGFDSLIRPKK